jgi:hypothetical protein
MPAKTVPSCPGVPQSQCSGSASHCGPDATGLDLCASCERCRYVSLSLSTVVSDEGWDCSCAQPEHNLACDASPRVCVRALDQYSHAPVALGRRIGFHTCDLTRTKTIGLGADYASFAVEDALQHVASCRQHVRQSKGGGGPECPAAWFAWAQSHLPVRGGNVGPGVDARPGVNVRSAPRLRVAIGSCPSKHRRTRLEPSCPAM